MQADDHDRRTTSSFSPAPAARKLTTVKILLVRRGFSATGGAEAYLLRLAAELARQGCQVALATSGEWPASAWPHGPLFRLPGATPSAFAAAFARLEHGCEATLALDRTPGCDVFRAGDGVHAAWLARRAALEPRWKTWMRQWSPKHGALLLLEKKVLETTPLVIANSPMVAAEIQRWHGVEASRLRVIPNGLGTAFRLVHKAEARRRLGVEESAYCLLFAGTGWERKGLAVAARAVEKMKPGVLLLAAGRGHPPRLASPRVRLLGPRQDLGLLFSAADAFVLPTYYDPFSNACLEALAAGLPVFTTTANGLASYLEPGCHGEVVEPGDPVALAQALEAWRGREASEQCRALAARFSISRNAAETLEALRAAANSARQTRLEH